MAESSVPSTSEHRTSLDGATSSSRRSNIPDLAGMCLSVITANFDRFSAAIKMRNSTVPPDHIEFLARRFSETLFNIMKSERTLKPEYFDFLINPYFKELDLVGIDVDLLPALSHKLKKGNNLLSCKVETMDDSGSIPSVISSLKKVESLLCRNCYLPEISKAIGNNCPFLKVLKFESSFLNYGLNDYTDSVCCILRGCPYLEVFEGVDTIGALYKIHTWNWFNMRIKKKVSKKAKKYFLKTLSSKKKQYLGYSLHDALEICAVVCPYTNSLNIHYLKDEKELDRCLYFPYLENVTFERISHDVSGDNLKMFFGLTGNKLLSLELPLLSSLDVQHLVECCPRLQTLGLLQCHQLKQIFSKDLSSIASLHFLTTLKIEEVDFQTQENAAALKLILCPKNGIKVLSLAGCTGLTKELLSNLDLVHIKELDVSSSDVETAALKNLLLNGNLQKLNIKNCVIDYFGWDVDHDDPRITGYEFDSWSDRYHSTVCVVAIRW